VYTPLYESLAGTTRQNPAFDDVRPRRPRKECAERACSLSGAVDVWRRPISRSEAQIESVETRFDEPRTGYLRSLPSPVQYASTPELAAASKSETPVHPLERGVYRPNRVFGTSNSTVALDSRSVVARARRLGQALKRPIVPPMPPLFLVELASESERSIPSATPHTAVHIPGKSGVYSIRGPVTCARELTCQHTRGRVFDSPPPVLDGVCVPSQSRTATSRGGPPG
jgi:hypothetical protein